MNPRRTQRPETVFETAAFDRSATPPREGTGYPRGTEGSGILLSLRGEVAEWLKAAPC